eukprot:m.254337 g.254337  ORF g.254337 m.254337 type:complete len:874 (+) comp16171_c0_seq4:403-3024(+)
MRARFALLRAVRQRGCSVYSSTSEGRKICLHTTSFALSKDEGGNKNGSKASDIFGIPKPSRTLLSNKQPPSLTASKTFFDTMEDAYSATEKQSVTNNSLFDSPADAPPEMSLPKSRQRGPIIAEHTPPDRVSKTSESVQRKLDLERRRLDPDPSHSEVGASSTNSNAAVHAGPGLADTVVSGLREQRATLRFENEQKMNEIVGLRLNAIQSNLPSSTQATMLLSLTGNLAIAAAKFWAYLRTGHQSMFSEAIHTLVDVGNQAILAYGLREASKAPDKSYQYGYGRAAFFYSLLTALSTFGFGAVYTFLEGVHVLTHPPDLLPPVMETWAVLAVSLAVDGFVLNTALKDTRKRAKQANVGVMSWLLSFKDPFTVAVIFEDSAAVLGVLFATGGIAMTQLTGNPMWDGIASISISALLASVSLQLIRLNRSFLLGKRVDEQITKGIRKILLQRRSVDTVFAAQTQWIGPSAFAFNAEVDFDGTYLAAQIYSKYELEIQEAIRNEKLAEELKWILPCFAEDVIRALEKEVQDIQNEVRAHYKEAAFIDIIPDSSQTTKLALEGMSRTNRNAEHAMMLALLSAGPEEDGEQKHDANFNLGCAYQAMGQFEKAAAPLQLSLTQREDLFGETHPLVASSAEALGSIYRSLGDYIQAVPLLQRAADILELTPDKEPRLIGLLARAYENLAQCYDNLHKSDDACTVAKKALDLRRQIHEENDRRVIDTLELVAEVSCKQVGVDLSRAQEAVEFQQELLVLLQQQDGTDTKRIIRCLMTLAKLESENLHDMSAAARHLEELVEMLQSTSSSSLEMADAKTQLAVAYRKLGIHEEAILLLYSALAIREMELHPRHELVLQVKNELIMIYSELGRYVPRNLFDN